MNTVNYEEKYIINNQNDYSIDTYVNDSKNHIAKQNENSLNSYQSDYDKNRNYKNKYYVNDSSNHIAKQNENSLNSYQSDIFYKKYCKYKNKYIQLKQSLTQQGGGKRYLKGNQLDKVNKEDISTITPIGSPTIMNTFLLQPEINFISKKFSKDKKLKKFCKAEIISKIVTEFYKYQQNGESSKNNLDNISKQLKVSKEFTNYVLKNHNIWKEDHFLRFEKK